MSLIRSLLAPQKMRAMPGGYAMEDYIGWLGGAGFPLLPQTWGTNKEVIEGDFTGLVRGAYEANGVVFACLMTRFMLFSQARFQFQQLRGGQPGDLFGTPDLRLIENPEPGETTADLLTVGLLDADLAGDWFGVRRPGRIKRLRPDWTTILVGSPNTGVKYPAWDPDAEISGYSFSTAGVNGPGETWSFERGEVAHFAPIRDPLAKYRGIPLPTAVLREVRGDSAATTHKLMFFEHAATPNLAVKFPPNVGKDKAKELIELFEQEHSGAFNAYRTIYLLGGMEANAVGLNFQQMEFAATQGKGETRIAMAMNVRPEIVGLSEGLQGSSLNAGNLKEVRRIHADKMLRPSWGSFAASLETIVPPLPGSRLWYDERHIPFLAADVKDAADVLFIQAQAIRQLVDGGFDADSVVTSVTSGDLRRLSHTGMTSVQLHTPGSADQVPTDMPMAARRDFWPSSGDWSGTSIARGDVYGPGHPVVAAFPSLFEPVTHPDGGAVRTWAAPPPIVLNPRVTVTTPVLPALPAPSPNGGQ